MCTLSWTRSADGYTAFFSRDERRSRAPARPPAAGATRGVAWLAPHDPEGGGTWIGVNELGVTSCLLNRHDPAPPGRTSRGQLLPPVLGAASPAEVRSRVCARDLRRFAPFTLVTLAPGHAAGIVSWDGRVITTGTIDRPGLLLTSSSVAEDAALRARRTAFAGALPTPEALAVIHHSHLPAVSALAVCMHRADAETVSLSRIDVTAARASFTYTPGAPCRGAPALVAHLARRARHAAA